VQRVDYDGETCGLAEVLDELRGFSMFASSKLVYVRNADKFIKNYREKLEDYVSEPVSIATLVLRCESLPGNTRLAKLIKKLDGVVEIKPPAAREIPAWVVKRAKLAHKLSVSAAAAEALVDFIGDDLGRLDNELAKLALQVQGKTVEPDDVRQSATFQREQEMWSLTDDLSAGKVDDAIRRWRQLVQLDTSAEFRGTTWLTIWLDKSLRALVLMKQGKSPASIARELKIWPADKADAMLRTAQRLGAARLESALDLLAECDRRGKSGLGDLAGNIERFLVSLA
jgi:DNA polymerase III delta subunit